MQKSVHIVGAGLAGSEAAHFLAEKGVRVFLHEMRPAKMTPAHKTDRFAELVCSNSFKSKSPVSGPGMLKAEMTRMGSLNIAIATASEVPGGEALAVDRERFSDAVTRTLRSHPEIEFVPGEVSNPCFEDGPTIMATGPLTSDSLAQWIAQSTGAEDLYFYDAIAPILDASTIDHSKVFLANRYGKGGEEAYLNCPMNEAQYEAFIDALLSAEKVPPKGFEKEVFFQGCQPIEAIAATGRASLRFGPMKPVGLRDRDGNQSFAVVQLRPENLSRTSYNMVGFQTKLKYGEQTRVFRLIPGLERAEFLRLGSIHRNTYVCGPRTLNPDLSLKGRPLVYLAGQMTGVEGYLESSACGLIAALFVWQRLNALPHHPPPPNTAMGALLAHVIGSNPDHYQPANIHFGLFDPNLFATPGIKAKRDEIRKNIASEAGLNFESWLGSGLALG